MKKLVRLDADFVTNNSQFLYAKKMKRPLMQALVAVVNAFTDDIAHPYFDRTAVRWELWLDGQRVFVRVYRPKPKAWPGNRRLIKLDYTVATLPEEVDHV